MTRTAVAVQCKSCGVDFHLYPDPAAHCVMSVICRCGAENEWTFPPKPSRVVSGFGFTPTTPPKELQAWMVEQR